MKLSLWVAALIVLAAVPALPISIGLFSDSDCTSCNLDIPAGNVGTFYVRAFPGGNYIEGAELRVVGLPPEWSGVCSQSHRIHRRIW